MGQGSPGEVKGRQGRSEEIRGESVVQGRSQGIMGGRGRSGEVRIDQKRTMKVRGCQWSSLESREGQGTSG